MLKNRYILNYFLLVASSSPAKFSKIVFPVWIFGQSLKLWYKNNFYHWFRTTQNQTVRSKLGSRKRGNPISVFHRNSLKHSNYQRDELNCNWLFIQCQATNNLTNPQNFNNYSIELTCSNFPCHLKVNRDKLALINESVKRKRLTITTALLMQIEQHDNSTCAVSCRYHDSGQK